MMMDTSDPSPSTSVVTSIERKTPIREFLPMQKNILSTILCRSPISLIEPWEPKEFLERRLDPLRPGLWININSHELYLLFNSISHQRSLLHTLGIRIFRRIFHFLFISDLFPTAMCWWYWGQGLTFTQVLIKANKAVTSSNVEVVEVSIYTVR